MTMRILHSGPQPTVTVSGRVTVDSTPVLRSALLRLLRRPKAPVIVVDLSRVSRLDLSGIEISLMGRLALAGCGGG
jgi:anti-anti-sigma regulatory factor